MQNTKVNNHLIYQKCVCSINNFCIQWSRIQLQQNVVLQDEASFVFFLPKEKYGTLSFQSCLSPPWMIEYKTISMCCYNQILLLGLLLQWTSDHVAFGNHNREQPFRGQACYRQLHRHRALREKNNRSWRTILFSANHYWTQLQSSLFLNESISWDLNGDARDTKQPWQNLAIVLRQLIWQHDNIL